MKNTNTSLDYEAGQKIAQGHYHHALKAVLQGSGDLQIAALIAIARELSEIHATLPPNKITTQTIRRTGYERRQKPPLGEQFRIPETETKP